MRPILKMALKSGPDDTDYFLVHQETAKLVPKYVDEFYPIFAKFCKNGSGDHI